MDLRRSLNVKQGFEPPVGICNNEQLAGYFPRGVQRAVNVAPTFIRLIENNWFADRKDLCAICDAP
jgi:hypothetical protein